MLRFLKTNLTRVFILFVLLLSACGGGGGGSSTTNQQNQQNDAGNSEQIVTLSVDIATPTGYENEPLKILSSQEETNYTGTASQVLSTNSPQFISALDSNDRMIYMGLTSGADNESIQINAKSTAISLLLLTPSIGMLSDDQLSLFLPLLRGLPEIDAFAIEIENNIAASVDGLPLWSTSFNSELQQAMANAINASVNALEAHPEIANLNTALSQNTSINSFVVLNPQTENGRSDITINTVFDSALPDKYSVSVTNSASRYVNVEFNLGQNSPTIKFLSPDETSDSYLLPGSDITSSTDSNKSTIDVYGPGIGSIPVDKNAGLVWEPTAQTIFNKILPPILKKFLGNTCGAEALSTNNAAKLSISVAQKLNEANVGGTITLEDLEQFASEAIYTVLLELNKGILTCAAKEQVKKYLANFIPVAGQVKVLIDATELTIKVGPTIVDIFTSKPHEEFQLVNDVILVGTFGLSAPDAVEDGGFTQSCPSNTVCERFVWDEAQNPDGLPVTFDFTCKGGCKTGSIGDQNVSFVTIFSEGIEHARTDADGVSRAIHEFKNEGVFTVEATIYDQHEAKYIKDLYQVEIEKAVPQISVSHGGLTGQDAPLPNGSTITLDIDTNTDPNSIDDVESFSIHNTGNGDLVIENGGLFLADTTYFTISQTVGTISEPINFPLRIKPNATFTFLVNLVQPGFDNVQTNLTINSNSNVDTNYTINLQTLLLNYTLAEKYFYNQEQIIGSIKAGDDVVHPNGKLRIFELQLDGVPVRSSIGNPMGRAYFFPNELFNENDVTYTPLNISVTDFTNNRTVSIPINLTVSNQAYREVVGTTITISPASTTSVWQMSFGVDGNLYETDTGATWGSYRFFIDYVDFHVICPDGTVNTATSYGAVDMPIVSAFVPSGIFVTDSGLLGNGESTCPDSTHYAPIQ